ncbi:hypothetical protein DQ04_07581020 [Trypanosoma grayi]|uniref:hypothetical protein n=1 Tax=Trypanosoma grayi TaxID=71804 RepID=UPI0004F45047|nr:hypothetical protein DQ04_07581020 [Trypanosoma grayi]KEG08268.1 hypothetical protein DQ04_07581020 [Trypanosoma grayi]
MGGQRTDICIPDGAKAPTMVFICSLPSAKPAHDLSHRRCFGPQIREGWHAFRTGRSSSFDQHARGVLTFAAQSNLHFPRALNEVPTALRSDLAMVLNKAFVLHHGCGGASAQLPDETFRAHQRKRVRFQELQQKRG